MDDEQMYYLKYLKYKQKYLRLKTELEGGVSEQYRLGKYNEEKKVEIRKRTNKQEINKRKEEIKKIIGEIKKNLLPDNDILGIFNTNNIDYSDYYEYLEEKKKYKDNVSIENFYNNFRENFFNNIIKLQGQYKQYNKYLNNWNIKYNKEELKKFLEERIDIAKQALYDKNRNINQYNKYKKATIDSYNKSIPDDYKKLYIDNILSKLLDDDKILKILNENIEPKNLPGNLNDTKEKLFIQPVDLKNMTEEPDIYREIKNLITKKIKEDNNIMKQIDNKTDINTVQRILNNKIDDLCKKDKCSIINDIMQILNKHNAKEVDKLQEK